MRLIPGMLRMMPTIVMVCGSIALTILPVPMRAEIAELRPAADTTLHQVTPGNNMGRHTHVAIGATAKDTAARGLFRFDLDAIPTNAVVSSVSITFNLPALNRPDATNALYSVHRMLTAWGEGTKQGNLGATATAGEAAWNFSAMPVAWVAPGGLAGTDFVAQSSATERMGPSPGVYMVLTTTGLVADVQGWVQNAGANFGWLLKAEDESITQTARQFSSREAAVATNAPLLRVEYSAEPVAELRITAIERMNTNVVIRWTGGQGSVGVERTENVQGIWEPVGESVEGVFTNAIQTVRSFYRLKN